MGGSARHLQGPGRPAGPLLRPGRHIVVGREAGDRSGSSRVPQGPHRAPDPLRSRHVDRWQGRAAAPNAERLRGIAMLFSFSSSLLELDLRSGKPPLLSVEIAVGASRWAADHRDALRSAVAQHGSVLVRGLGLRDAAGTEAVFRHLGSLMTERESFAPRQSYAPGVYSSMKWPPQQPMCMHHELSY